MSDKQITVGVPEERVPEFYAWFAQFLAAPSGEPAGRGGRGFRHGPGRRHGMRWGRDEERSAWTASDAEAAAWLYGRLSEPARALFDKLIADPGTQHSGNELALELGLEKGAQGLVGILAWPGRWCAKLGKEFPIDARAREDGGTDYGMSPETAAVFAAAAGRARG